jgi:hypothetical protein
MVSRPDEPGRSGLGPDQSDTPPDDLPELPRVPDDADVPYHDDLLDPEEE